MKTLFWNVDTQKDFMNPDGKLYVPDAEILKENLRMLTEHAWLNGIRMVYSADAHSPHDKELIPNGGAFPPHCMKGTLGAELIPETKPLHPRYVENRSYTDAELEEIVQHPGELVIEKNENDVFTNPNTEKIIRLLHPEKIIVYGVATDYCVKDAVAGLVKFADVYIVEDTIKPVFPKKVKPILEEMRRVAKFLTLKDILEGRL